MNIGSIDEALESYVNERMERGKETASERFLANVYLRNEGTDTLEFLLKAGGLARCYIYCLKIAEKSLNGTEIAWFSAMTAVGLYGLFLMAAPESRVVGIVLLAGALVHAWSLVSMLVKKSRAIGMRINIYREIVQIVEKELCR
jgi:uncharacterized membrane protein YecN with MAPEG domain